MGYGELYHYGTATSGRYPRGSGKHPRNRGGAVPSSVRKHRTEVKPPTYEEKKEIISSGDPLKVNMYKKYLSTKDINDAQRRIEAEDKIGSMAKSKAYKRIVDSGDAMLINSHKKNMSINDIEEAKRRINSEQSMAKMAEEQKRRMSKGYRFAMKVDKLNKATMTAKKLGESYNVAASYINSFTGKKLKKVNF